MAASGRRPLDITQIAVDALRLDVYAVPLEPVVGLGRELALAVAARHATEFLAQVDRTLAADGRSVSGTVGRRYGGMLWSAGERLRGAPAATLPTKTAPPCVDLAATYVAVIRTDVEAMAAALLAVMIAGHPCSAVAASKKTARSAMQLARKI